LIDIYWRKYQWKIAQDIPMSMEHNWHSLEKFLGIILLLVSPTANISVVSFFITKMRNRPEVGRFRKLPNSTKVRVLADSHGLGDQGLGTGLVVRRPPVVQSTIIGYLILAGPL
jgi:hypothetical protein